MITLNKIQNIYNTFLNTKESPRALFCI